jgi:hypothetical protein
MSTRSVPAGRVARPSGHAGGAGGEYAPGAVELARRVVEVLGGRYSAELGIDVDAGDAEVERWFVAATLFGRGSRRVSRNGHSACWRPPGWRGSASCGTSRLLT